MGRALLAGPVFAAAVVLDPARPIRGLRDSKLLSPERRGALAIVKGDRDVASISAVSILAKTARDALLIELGALYPHYGFAQNNGYGTPEHLAARERHGPCPIYRRSFAPVVQSALPF